MTTLLFRFCIIVYNMKVQMKIFILFVGLIVHLSGCKGREPIANIGDEILETSVSVTVATYTGNAMVKMTNGDPCKFAMVYLPDTYQGYKCYFYADTKGFICLKFYTVKPDQGDPPRYITTSCVIYRNQFDLSEFVAESIQVKHSDNCHDDEINSLVVVFTDSLDL